MNSTSLNPLISILCVSSNRLDFLKRALECCVKQDWSNIEIIVIDNANLKRIDDEINEEFPSVKVFRTHKNIGFFPALNLAIATSHGEFLVTIDDDAYFESVDALSEWIKRFQADPELMITTCNINGPNELPPEPSDRYVHNFKTGFSMIRRKVFDELCGYYPDAFFRSGGESYLCTALWDQGFRVLHAANVWMYHDQTLIGRNSWAWNYYGARSQNLVMLIRTPWYLLLPSILVKMFNGLAATVRTRSSLYAWFRGWVDLPFLMGVVKSYRNPISSRTVQLLKSLRCQTIRTLAELEALQRRIGHRPLSIDPGVATRGLKNVS
jgi:GT2 family glycosyltransferase